MHGGTRFARRAALATFAGLLLLVGLVFNRGAALSWQMPGCPLPHPGVESPPGEFPLPPSSPGSPMPPISAAPGAPGAPMPDGSAPLGPSVPFVGPETDVHTPMVRLRVRAPAEVQPEKEIEYQLTVENISQAAAHHVTLRDRLPRGTTFVRAKPEPTKKATPKEGMTDLLWELGTLKPGERKSFVVALQAKGTDEIQNNAYVQFEHGQTVKTRIARPSLSLRIVAPSQAAMPDPISLRLEVTNTGTLPAHDVVLKDELPEGLVVGESKPPLKGSDKSPRWDLGTLKPGEMRRVELQLIATEAGTFTNKAEVTAKGGVSRKTSVEIKVIEAKLDITNAGPRRRTVHRPTPFHITVRNPGTAAATNVEVSNDVPTGIEFVSASMGGRYERGRVRWMLGTLRPGERRLLQVILRSPEPGKYWNEASARADRGLTARSRTEAMHFDAATGPAIEIDKNADPIPVGTKAIYTIRLVNLMKAPLRNRGIIVTVPNEMGFLTQRGDSAGRSEGQTIHFDPLPSLESGREATYAIEAEAKRAGPARLVVELVDSSRSGGTRQTWEETTTIEAAPRLAPRSAPPGNPTLQVKRTRPR